MRLRARGTWVAVLLIALVPIAGGTRGAAQAPEPSATDMVPVNVHVVDRAGKPVLDLKQSDFTVTENGVVQPIRAFTVQNMTPASADSARLVPRTRLAASAQDHRIFVIMLGRGRLEDPSMALSGVIALVRKLMPQDQVAVFAHNRALPLTTDHEKVAQALERCRKAHLDVDLDVDNQLGALGMAALYGTKAMPRKTQARIDEMLFGAGAKPPAAVTGDTFDAKAFEELSLDDFMFSTAQTVQDRGNLQVLVEYLRRYDGEKHLLFLTERGVDKGTSMPNEEFDNLVAQLANDGRTTIHTLQTGGMLAPENGKELDATRQQALAFAELRTIAERSGGAPAIMQRGGVVLDRLDEMTRTGYVLGYRSSATSWDGAYRTIEVKVNRPDVTVLHRQGYYRQQSPGGFDRRGQITADRLMAAGNFRRDIGDIKIKAKASQNHGQGGGALTVDGKIEVAKLALTLVKGKYEGRLDVAVFCIDSGGWSVGTHNTTLTLSLTDEEMARHKKDGMPYLVQFPMYGGTERVRVVVYDYKADLIGRTEQRMF